MNHINLVGFANVYSDRTQGFEIFKSLGNPISIDGPIISFPSITVPTFLPNDYFRFFFPVAQPPLFLLDLAFTNSLKNLLSINSDYVVLNLTNIVFSFTLTLLISSILRERSIKRHRTWALALVWANPLLILQSNIQGYRDLLLLNLITLSIKLMDRDKKCLYLSGAVFALACMTKPTAIFVVIVFFICLTNRAFLKFLIGMTFSVSMVFAIYLFTDRLFGLVAAIFTEFSFTQTFSEGISFWSTFKLLFEYTEYLPISSDLQSFTMSVGNILLKNLTLISILHLGIFLLIALKMRRDSKIDIFGRRIQIFIIFFYFLMPNSRMNHYFVFLSILLIAIPVARERLLITPVIALIFLQDLLYGGFGRNSFFEGTRLSLPINIVTSILITSLSILKICRKNPIVTVNPKMK